MFKLSLADWIAEGVGTGRILIELHFERPSMSDPILCPECGWTGKRQDLEDDQQCPVCDEDIEFMD